MPAGAIRFAIASHGLKPLDGLGLALLFVLGDGGCGLTQLGQHFSWRFRDQQRKAEIVPDEFQLAHMVEQAAERVPEAIDVQDQDRLLVTPELRPGELLDQFFQRADAAGQGGYYAAFIRDLDGNRIETVTFVI